ncbi:MAG: HAMP domain-containing protein [Candidatus Omnitrophota bacterium]
MALKEYFVRKQLLIEKSLQFKYMGLVLLTILGISGIFVLTFYFIHGSLINQKLSSIGAGPIIDDAMKKANVMLMFEIPIALFVAAFASIIVSHKVAGPVYRLQKVAHKVARGDLSQNVRLRRNDELKNLSQAFNAVIENMQLLVVKDKKLINELSQLTDTLYNNLKDKKIDENEALVLIRKLNDLVGELKTLILQYKVDKNQ